MQDRNRDALPGNYSDLAAEEGRIWSENARQYTEAIPPDWRFMRHEYGYRFVYRREIETLLDRIQPGQRVLEMGCNKGWLALEMARCGAQVDAGDIAEGALQIARDYYESARRTELFEGIGRSEEPLKVIRELFEIIDYDEKAAFAGFLSAELKLPYRAGAAVMQVLWAMDRACVKLKLLHGLNYAVYARVRTGT